MIHGTSSRQPIPSATPPAPAVVGRRALGGRLRHPRRRHRRRRAAAPREVRPGPSRPGRRARLGQRRFCEQARARCLASHPGRSYESFARTPGVELLEKVAPGRREAAQAASNAPGRPAEQDSPRRCAVALTTSAPAGFAITLRASKEPLGALVTRTSRATRDPFTRQHDRPGDAVPVLVDLELDLDPAVLFAQLQLRGARARARPADEDVAVLRQRRGSEREQHERSRRAPQPSLRAASSSICTPFGSTPEEHCRAVQGAG